MKLSTLVVMSFFAFALTACPEQNNDPPPTSTDMSRDDGVDLPDMMEMPDQGKQAPECRVVRTEPTTLPMDDVAHSANIIVSCAGEVTLGRSGTLQRQHGEGGQVESITCEVAAQTTCVVRLTGLIATASPGEEALSFTTDTTTAPLNALIRWHWTPKMLRDNVANIKVRAAKQAMGVNSLGAAIRVVDGDPTVVGWASKDKCCEELVFEKGLSFGMDVSKYKLDEDKPPQPPGNIVDQQTSLASSPDGFDSMLWGQSEDTTNNTSSFYGIRYALDQKGQRVDRVSLQPAEVELKRLMDSGVYLPKELGIDSALKTGEVVALHSTSTSEWALTRLFTGLARDEVRPFKFFKTLAGLTPAQVEQGVAWVGLLNRPVQSRVEDGRFVFAAWAAQKINNGITLHAVPLGKAATGDASSSITVSTGFEVAQVYVGFVLPGRLVVLAVGAQGQERLFALNTPNGFDNLKPLFIPDSLSASGSFVPVSHVPEHSVFYRTHQTLPVMTNAAGNLLLLHQGTNSLVRWRWDEEAQGTLLSVVPQLVDDATQKSEQGQLVSLSPVSSSSFAVVTLDPLEETCGADNRCFAPIVQAQNGLEVGLIGGKQPQLGVSLGQETMPLEMPSAQDIIRWFKPRIAQLNTQSMIFIPVQTKASMHADAMIFWIVDAQGQPSQPAMAQVSKTADHRTFSIADMSTEVIVFFRPDTTQGVYGTVSVETLKAMSGQQGVQTLRLATTHTVTNTNVQSPLIFGPGTSFDVQAGSWSSETFETSTLASNPIQSLRLSQDNCPQVLLDQFSSPKAKPLTSSVDLLPPGVSDGCEGQRRWVARGDFLGSGGQQVMWFDGQSFSLLFTSQNGTQLVRVDDVYSFETPQTIQVVAEDFNLDGLTDLAVDHGHPDGVMILFSDGLGKMLSSSGRIPAVSLVVDVNASGVDPRYASFGSGTKKSTNSTKASLPQLQ